MFPSIICIGKGDIFSTKTALVLAMVTHIYLRIRRAHNVASLCHMITNLEPVVIANTTEFFRTHAGLTATIPRREHTLQVRLKHLLVHTLSKLQTVQNSNQLF